MTSQTFVWQYDIASWRVALVCTLAVLTCGLWESRHRCPCRAACGAYGWRRTNLCWEHRRFELITPSHGKSDILAPRPSAHPLTTTVIGSWPKPSWLSSGAHDISGWAVDREWRFHGEELRRKQDEATEWALRQQEKTGVDIVSDGEIRRDNYVHYYCQHLDGFDFERRARITGRSGAWSWAAPMITGPIASRQSCLAADYQFIRDRTERCVKMTIPGPMTIIDSVADEYYRDDVALAMDLAATIRMEVEALAAAGCHVVQFDEPVFARFPNKVSDYGLRALEACFEGVTGITTVVHVCRGYPIEGYDKANADSYTHLAPMLANSKIDQISIEGAHGPLDLGVLRRFGDKGLIFGVVDAGDSRIETVEEIEARIKQVLGHVRPDRLSVGPDCGMVFLDPEVAKAKLTNLVEGARRVREGL